MPTVTANGIEIDVATFGNPGDPALVMIHGLGAQRIDWRQSAIDRFVDDGLFVITFDNRDQGLSTWFDQLGEPDIIGLLFGEGAEAPYLVGDMAADTAGVLEALGIDGAHILGVSMGGMIAQQFAIDYPTRTITLTSIMSTPSPSAGPPTEAMATALLQPAPTTREDAIALSIEGSRLLASPGFPFDEADVRARAEAHFDRGNHPVGTARQLAAILASPDRAPGLGTLDVEALVVHGTDDPLVTFPGGQATAEALRHVEFWAVEGMAHDLPEEVVPELVARHTALRKRAQ